MVARRMTNARLYAILNIQRTPIYIMKRVPRRIIEALGFGTTEKEITENLDRRMLAAQDITNPNTPYMRGLAPIPAPYVFVVDVSRKPGLQRDDLANAVNILAGMGYEAVTHAIQSIGQDISLNGQAV